MLRFSLFGFPISVHWMFWLNTALLGGAIGASTDEEVLRLVLWMAAAFVSIIVHELGHAFLMRRYGAYASIALYALGGVAIPNRRFTRGQDIIVSLAGPVVQILSGLLIWLLASQLPAAAWAVKSFFGAYVFVSIFWGILNLFPIYPLDGGHILSGILGPRRQRITYGVGAACAIAIVIWSLIGPGLNLFGILLFGMMAYENIQRMRGVHTNSMLNPQ